MPTASPTPTRDTRIAGLTCVRDIRALEQRWTRSLRTAAARPRITVADLTECTAGYEALVAYTDSLQFLQRGPSSELDRLIETYGRELDGIHQDVRAWLVIALDMAGGAELSPDARAKRSKKLTPDLIRQEAATAWSTLTATAPAGTDTADVFSLKRQRDACEHGTPEWRVLNRRLLGAVRDAAAGAANTACLRIDRLFERIIYRESAQQLLAGDAPPDDFGTQIRVRRVEDWIRGYLPGSDREDQVDRGVWERFARDLRSKLLRRRIRQGLLVLALAAAAGGIIFFLQTSRVDNDLWDAFSGGAQKMFGLDPASRRMKERRKFFADQIVAINRTYTETGILNKAREFAGREFENEQERALWFAENVLKGYFLLLTDRKTSNRFKNKILDTAREYDDDIHHHLHSITAMFSSDKMTESHFRIHTLMLRRAFTDKGVFPFLFLSLYKNHPYVFLYPERIIDEYYFEDTHMEEIGLNVAWYSHAANIPLVAHIIEGKNYPFGDRAGYFEGQYAIVFQHIAANARWTAWHEFGHSLDQMRNKFGKQPYPVNVEQHAMLMPVIFADDPVRYVRGDLVRKVSVGDPRDLYVQAAKGILNGFALYFSERDPALRLPLIGDTFRPRDVTAVVNWIITLPAEELRAAGRELYRNSPKYLSTARGGTYRGHFANAEEVVAGAHGPPTVSYTIDTLGDGDFTTEGSTRFIRDTQQDAGGPKDLWSFIKAVIYITLHPGATTKRRDSLEALVSSILIFVLVEGLLMLIQWWGSPLRRRKYNGVEPLKIINEIYDKNPWSDGRSTGEEAGERALLARYFQKTPQAVDAELAADIAAFKTAADKKRMILFDVCLTLAPWQPARSAVRTRRHNLLFWLPFLGPVMARWAWIMPRQRPFHQREAFNARLRELCLGVRENTTLEDFLDGYKQIMLEFQSDTVRETVEHQDEAEFLDALEKQVHDSINAAGTRVTLRKPMVTHRAVQNYHEDVDFDRLDKYVFGDDIKRIDWRATARAVNNEPLVRKSASIYGLNVGFLLDFRAMHQHARREQFALDFVKSLRMLGKDRDLRQLIFIMPNGEIFHRRVRIKFPVAAHARARLLWAKVRGYFQEKLERGRQLDIPGLRFYSDEENELYRQRYKLTEFPYRSTEGIVFEKLALNSLNIFLIGMDAARRHEIPRYLPGTNQVFFW